MRRSRLLALDEVAMDHDLRGEVMLLEQEVGQTKRERIRRGFQR